MVCIFYYNVKYKRIKNKKELKSNLSYKIFSILMDMHNKYIYCTAYDYIISLGL